ncbi:unnamed protein product [Ranitomeya imitator]|uniref:Aquaporin-4 n=1 Tax=Ranitomeya imitator TaxID=111125 RepID=A0ABN9MIL1_9NEOB|nr:unnamed protein product [Ranitomeya imitator]
MVAFKGVWTQSFWKAVSGEFVATLIFVFLGLGSTVNWGTTDNPQQIDIVQISLCFGLGIATMVHCFGHISGGHINPAVTIALLCTRNITLAKALFYITAQCLGALLAAGLLYLLTPPSLIGNLGVTMGRVRFCETRLSLKSSRVKSADYGEKSGIDRNTKPNAKSMAWTEGQETGPPKSPALTPRKFQPQPSCAEEWRKEVEKEILDPSCGIRHHPPSHSWIQA